MPLYDAPVHTGYKILTHTSKPLYEPNGFKQVGNTTFPTNPINPQAVKASAIYNKNLKGISEAGYGKAYPFYGLSYAGAGSPRSSLKYSGAGSPRTSLRYAGAGSPRTSLKYAGAGSPSTSLLKDPYINDNPQFIVARPSVIPGRVTTTPRFGIQALKGLADEPAGYPDTDFGVALPSTNLWGDVTNAFGSIFSSTVSAGTQSATKSIQDALSGKSSSGASVPVTANVTGAAKAVTTNILGMSAGTALLLGGGVLAYVLLKK